MLNNKTLLITGGTGSFGKKFITTILRNYRPKKLIVFSRDELKQFEMQETLSKQEYPCIRYFIGDVRDKDRLYRAFHGVDYVVHTAALKQVPSCEYNPIEAVKTNVMGAANVIDAAIDRGVKRVIALSTDKAVSPINLYGATKLCSDKLFVSANSYSGAEGTRFSVVRYGNVVGSRGSVIPQFIKARENGELLITDKEMTRFWITLDQSVKFVLDSLFSMVGGEVYVPKLPSMKIVDLAKAVAPECKMKFVGVRPGEKLHEVMISEDDAKYTIDMGDYFLILPFSQKGALRDKIQSVGGKPCPDNFRYASDNNHTWLTVADIQRIIAEFDYPVR